MAPHALEVMQAYDWPGNVRELQNVLAYAYAIGDGPLLQASDLPPELAVGPRRVQADTKAPSELLDRESRKILEMLDRTQGNKHQAAKLLGISRVTLWRRLRALGWTEP